jgi:RNA polymerase sigma-70 factor (ECF subfamily)
MSRQTFEEWYESVAHPLTARIVAGVGDPVLGREAAAEALARAWERWDRVGALDSPEGWVYRTAINLCRSRWRRRRIEARALARMPAVEVVTGPEAVGDVLVGGHEVDGLDGLVAALPPRMQTAVRLRYWDGLGEDEVAAAMGIAPGTASAMLSQARRRLGSALDGKVHDDA